MDPIHEKNRQLRLGYGIDGVFFAIPVPPWNEIAGVVLGLIDTLFEAFTGDAPAANPAITRSELKEAVDGVRDQLNDSFWRTDVDQITFEVLALYQGFYDAYAFVSKVPLDRDRLVFPANNDTVKHLIRRMDEYFGYGRLAQDTGGILTTLREAPVSAGIEGWRNGQHYRRPPNRFWTTNYSRWRCTPRSGSLTVAYLKTRRLLWNWGKEMLGGRAVRKLPA